MSVFKFQIAPPNCEMLASAIDLSHPDINLFNETAQSFAKEMAYPELLQWNKRDRTWEVKHDKNVNKITQLRKFYDEVCMWEAKSKNLQVFSENLPFIKMLNAKVAYARSREYVDDKFVTMIAGCLSQINETNEDGMKKFKNFKTFFEAFYGFYRAERIKD
ncbi:MAG: type III-A CRISPR-associated protein Csm2 [Methylococcales bacterium]